MQCPVCMDPVEETSCLRLACGHTVHDYCMLSAAQYDVRCPVCRQVGPNIAVRDDARETNDVLEEVERIHREFRQRVRHYNIKRNRAIRKHDRLLLLRNNIRTTYNDVCTQDEQLHRYWNQLQRTMWRDDTTLADMKRLRSNSMRRLNRMTRQLNESVENVIGNMPSIRIATQ